MGECASAPLHTVHSMSCAPGLQRPVRLPMAWPGVLPAAFPSGSARMLKRASLCSCIAALAGKCADPAPRPLQAASMLVVGKWGEVE